MPALRTLLAALLLTTVACPGAGGAGSTQTAARPRPRSDLITLDEISRAQYANAFDLVNGLRPQWLRSRGATTIEGPMGEIQVVLDDVKLGGLGALRTLPTSGITYVQWFDGMTASSRWGLDFSRGAIYISTRQR